MKTVFLFFFAFTIALQTQSQERLITGTVSSASDDLPLVGVTILIKGTTKGTITNFEGDFEIKAKSKDILIFSYLGYLTKKVIVGSETNISVVLKEDMSTLDEVVVIGYAATKKKSIAGAVTTVVSESISSKLSGKVMGVSTEYNEPSSGQLTAGEINDLENWSEWKEKSKDENYKKVQKNWQFNLEHKILVNVNDTNGIPLNNIKVSLFNELNELIMTSRTDFTGSTFIFKDLNKICNNDYFTIQIQQNQKILGKRITNSYNKVDFILDEQKESNNIDVMFTIDATGSMGDEIAYLKSELKNIFSRIDNSIDEKRVALTFYRDHGDAYVVKDFDFSTNIDSIKEILSRQNAGGGGDYEEAVEQALKVSMQKSWNIEAKSKLLFLLLDAPPHFNQENVTIIKNQIKLAQERGIKIIPIVASGANKDVEFLMRFFSVSTNGTYVFLTDDSGIGNSHLKPSTNDYKVEKLNDLIIRLIEKYSGVIG